MDSRIICLNSIDAVKLNGNYNSNLFFNIPNIVDENPLIDYITVSLEDATIPVSWYLINDSTNTLNYIYNSLNYQIILTNGNYNGSSIITELQNKFNDNGLNVVITLSQVSGILLFKFTNPITPIEFIYSSSKGLMDLLGFNQTTSGVSITGQLPMNLLGIQTLKICSGALSSLSSFSSSNFLSNQIVQSIPVDMPAFHQITYINKDSHNSRLKNRYINNIDIQIFDEYGRFIEFNGIDFNLTFNIKIYRFYNVKHGIINIKNEDKNKDNNLQDEEKDNNLQDEELELLLKK